MGCSWNFYFFYNTLGRICNAFAFQFVIKCYELSCCNDKQRLERICNCITICNNWLQIGTHLHLHLRSWNYLFCITWHACNKMLYIVKYFRWYAENTSDQGVAFFVSADVGCDWHSPNSYHLIHPTPPPPPARCERQPGWVRLMGRSH